MVATQCTQMLSSGNCARRDYQFPLLRKDNKYCSQDVGAFVVMRWKGRGFRAHGEGLINQSLWHTQLSIRVSFNKSPELQSHFHCRKRLRNNNMIVDWSLEGSEGKCMWWGIMMPHIYLCGWHSTKGFLYKCITNLKLFQINYVFPSTWNSLTAATKHFHKAYSYCAYEAPGEHQFLYEVRTTAESFLGLQHKVWAPCGQYSTLGMGTVCYILKTSNTVC